MTFKAYTKYAPLLLGGYCIAAALSIAAAQILVVAAIIFWFYILLSDESNSFSFSSSSTYLAVPIVSWITISFISAGFGFQFLNSLSEVVKTSFYLLLPFCVCHIIQAEIKNGKSIIDILSHYLLLLCLGQLIASIHTILSRAFLTDLPPKIPGAVTESGQLVMIIPCALILLLTRTFRKDTTTHKLLSNKQLLTQSCILGILSCALTLLIAWPTAISNSITSLGNTSIQLVAFATLGIITFFVAKKGPKNHNIFLFSILIGMLLGALVINLKRGPWLGVVVELVILSFVVSRRLLLAMLFLIVFLVSLEPVKERLTVSTEHFTIRGGRQVMWEIGGELSERYPLGLGPSNAGFMQSLDPSIPEQHRHMHNNLLNIVVETGWLGLVTYSWWIIAVLTLGAKTWHSLWRSEDPEKKMLSVYPLGLTCALIGWQFAGLVEYNFGDGEIRLIAFFLMGLILTIANFNQSSQLTETI